MSYGLLCLPPASVILPCPRRVQGVSYRSRQTDGALLIGPFGIWPPDARESGGESTARQEAGAEGGEDEDGVDGEDGAPHERSHFPPELLYALQVIGMEHPEEGPTLTLDELELLKGTLEARLHALLPSEAADQAALGAVTRAGFVAAYRDGQRRVLRGAIEEVDDLAAGAMAGEEDNGVDEDEADS